MAQKTTDSVSQKWNNWNVTRSLQKAFRLKLLINTLSNPSVSNVMYICTLLSHTNVVNKQHYNFTTD